MQSEDKLNQMNTINKEWDRIVMAGGFKSIKRSALPKNAKILSSTQVMKKKSNGKYRVCLNVCRYKQQLGLHYFEDNILSLTMNNVTICILLVLM